MATPPTRVSYTTPTAGYLSAATPKTTPTISVQSGDLLTVIGSTEDFSTTLTTPTATGVTFTLRQSVLVNNYCAMYVWTAPITTTNASLTVSVGSSGAGGMFGFGVTVWRNHGGVGTSAKTNVASGAPSLAITTAANSAIVVGSDDWTATDGTSRVWRSVNGSPITESLYARTAANYTVYSGYAPDAGAAGSKTVGLSAPSGQKYSIVAVEVLGSTPSGTTYAVTGTVDATSDTPAPSVNLLAEATGTVDATSDTPAPSVKLLAAATGTVAGTSATPAPSVALKALVAGTSVAVSTVSGSARLLAAATGTVAGTSTTAGDITVISGPQVYSVSGTVAAVSATAGDATGILRGMAGAVVAVSGTAGTPVALLVVSGSVAGTSATAGSPSGILRGMSGTVAGTSGTAGDLLLRALLSGSVTGVSATSGAIIVTGSGPQTYQVSGAVVAVSTVTGTPVFRLNATGTIAGTSVVSGTVTGLFPVSAPAIAGVSGTAAGTVRPLYALTGTVNGISGVAGTITSRLQVNGTCAAVSAGSGFLGARLLASGTVAGVSSVSGTPGGLLRGLSGTVTATSGVFGVLMLAERDNRRVILIKAGPEPVVLPDERLIYIEVGPERTIHIVPEEELT